MKVSRSWLAVVVAALLFSLRPEVVREGSRAASPPGPYAVTDLGILGTVQSAHAHDINEAAQVTGYSGNRAFLWENGLMTDLGTLGGNGSIGLAVNELGQVAGYSTVTGNSSRAVLWDNGAITNLTPDLAPGDGSSASGLNEVGQVVGTINNWIPFVWQNGTITTLGHLGGGGGSAADINDAGQVVGVSYTTDWSELLGPVPHAALWQNGAVIDLGLFPGDEDSWASAINNLGQIVGSSGRTDMETYESTYRPFLYENGVMTAIPVPSPESYAVDINDSGVVVGTMRAGGGPSRYHAYIYADGVVTNLNTRIPPGAGLHLIYANAINNAGQIVGVAYDSRGSYHAYLLTPLAPGTPVVNIADGSVTEGHAGTQSASLTLSLSTASSQPVTVAYSTANGSAGGSDYQSASGTVTFAAGQTSATVAVLVNGDRDGEPNETFLVNLGSAQGGAVIGDGQAVATIVDDEPRVSVNDVSKSEGHSGTTPFVFTVSLSPAPAVGVSVNFATANGSARAGEDYDARSGALAFAAGETSKTVAVTVRGDRRLEANEVFYLNVSGGVGTFVSDSQGTGVIRNDDWW
jgi:probable HAF family extracellular repeat protein